MKRVAFVSAVPIFPPHGGARVRILNMIKAVRDLGYNAHLIFLPSRQMGDFDEEAHFEFFGNTYFHMLRRSKLGDLFYFARRIYYSILRRWKRLQGRSTPLWLNVDETYFRAFTKQIREIDSRYSFDAVVAEYVTFTRAFEGVSSKAIRIVDTLDRFVDALPVDEERRGLSRADAVVAIQDEEARYFKSLLPNRSSVVTTVSHFIEIADPIPVDICLGATFVGSNFDANRASILWFLDQVLPLVLKQEPHFQIVIAGSICDAVPDRAQVRKLGRVERFADAFRDTPVLINPITSGAGVKTKLLEAFGSGIPVVSTRLGVEGIAAEYLKATLISVDDDPQGFADALVRLMRDNELRRRFSQLAIDTARAWNSINMEQMSALLALKTPAGPSLSRPQVLGREDVSVQGAFADKPA